MIFEQIATGGCQSYLIGCGETCAAALIDPELSQIDHYLALAARDGLRIRYVIDTHTHADHFSATRELARQLERAGGHAPREPGALRRHARGRRRDGGARQAAAAGACTRRATRADSMCLHGRGPRVHRRHAADRRHRPHRPAQRRSGGALRQPVQPRAAASTRRSRSTRRTTTRAAATRRSARRSRPTRACRSATAPSSSR